MNRLTQATKEARDARGFKAGLGTQGCRSAACCRTSTRLLSGSARKRGLDEPGDSGAATPIDTLDLDHGVFPRGASLRIPTANGFWILDQQLVIAEDWYAEMWLEDSDTVAGYMWVWETRPAVWTSARARSAPCGPAPALGPNQRVSCGAALCVAGTDATPLT